jgi:UDP-2,3-diacylglucosamine pyrophosphatase LpxH
LSKAIKAKVKSAVSHLSQFENHLKQVAQKNDCTGVICGHIHTPENKMIAGVHYLNSGDWVESLTAIVEDFSGTFKVVEYADFCREHNLFNVSSASNDSSVKQAVEA